MKKKKAGSMAVMLLILIYLLIPLVVSIIYSMFDKWTGIAPEGFNLGNYATLFSDPEFLATMGRTVAMCIIPICLTIVIVLLALFVTTIYFPKLEKYVQIICMIPYTIQGYPFRKYFVPVCRVFNISEQSSGDVVRCVLYYYFTVYLSGNPEWYAGGQYADAA